MVGDKILQMTVRDTRRGDYEMFVSWWDGHVGWEAPLEHALPDSGFLVEGDGFPVVAGWLYRTDSSIAWLEWIISNPQASKEERADALPILIERLTHEARMLGFKIVFTSTNNKRLLAQYEEAGFATMEKDVIHLVRRIG